MSNRRPGRAASRGGLSALLRRLLPGSRRQGRRSPDLVIADHKLPLAEPPRRPRRPPAFLVPGEPADAAEDDDAGDPDGDEPSSSPPWATLALVVMVLAMGAFVWASGDHPDIGTGLVLGPVLVALSAPIIARLGRTEHAFDLAGVMFLALSLKLLATVFRYLITFDVYEGVADSPLYHEHGVRLAESFRRLDFDVDVLQELPGTGAVRYLTGLVYAVFGDNLFAGYLVFGWFSFWGVVLFYMAFRTAVPEGNHRRYALLVLLWPSVLFWPASVGKEGWMIFTVGLTAYGAARALRRLPGGVPLAAAGLLGIWWFRPHMALMVLAAIAPAYLLRRAIGESQPVITGKVVGLVVLAVGGSMVAGQAATFLGVESLSMETVNAELDENEERTNQGGSSFEAVRVRTPLHFPPAAVTVLFRPLPHEARSTQTLASAAEGVVLAALFLRHRRSLRGLPRLMADRSYVVFAFVYIAFFVFAFSSVANFGILARQRTQVLPLVFVFLALPRMRRAAAPPPISPPTVRGATRSLQSREL